MDPHDVYEDVIYIQWPCPNRSGLIVGWFMSRTKVCGCMRFVLCAFMCLYKTVTNRSALCSTVNCWYSALQGAWYVGLDFFCIFFNIPCDIDLQYMCRAISIIWEVLFYMNKENRSDVSTTDGWWKLNVAKCVMLIRRVLVLYSICNTCMVFVNKICDLVVHTQFHSFYGR